MTGSPASNLYLVRRGLGGSQALKQDNMWVSKLSCDDSFYNLQSLAKFMNNPNNNE
jgi:hypothetical protein